MKISSRLTVALTLSMLLALGSCAQTKIKGIWKDPTYRGGRVQKIMVLAVADNPNGRRIFENQFVAGPQILEEREPAVAVTGHHAVAHAIRAGRPIDVSGSEGQRRT